MRVYNLTDKPLDYRGKMIVANGSLEYPELDVFIPDRDRLLEAKRVLAFGSLPMWWKLEKDLQVASPKPPERKEPRQMEVPGFLTAKKTMRKR